VEVRAHFFSMGKGVQEYRIPERVLPSGANELHTLYMRSPRSYGSQPLTVDFYKDGRLANPIRPQFRLVGEENWLVYAVGPQENTNPLNILSTAQLPQRAQGPAYVPPGARRPTAQVSVATSEPAETPDRWQGLDAADAVVLTGVSERDFRPEQLAAVREYAVAGGTVVVTGGLNWNRLTSPWFRDMLPATVTGSGTVGAFPAPRGGAAARGPIPILTATPRPGAEVVLRSEGQPLIISGKKGAGRVVFLAFDPSLEPLRAWSGTAGVWASLLTRRPAPTLIDRVTQSESAGEYYGGVPQGYFQGGGARLADAPFAIPQLDIPAYYVVALFLLAYVIILVPVNYFFLKARDKKEYAWLTTPAIVLLFSVGAYLIGYGTKGGSTLAVRVGLLEAQANQDAGRFLFYSGIFSPRKTAYDIRFAAAAPAQDSFSNALFTEPESSRSDVGLILSQDDCQKVEDFAVDMWAMRVLRADGVASLGKGFSTRVLESGGRLTGTVRNNTPYALEGCSLLSGGGISPVGNLAPGGTVTLNGAAGPTSGPLLAPQLADQVPGDTRKARMRRAILQALSGGGGYPYASLPAGPPQEDPRLIGWLTQPVGTLSVDGRPARDTAETLVVVHLGS
jgi:hypothetical protein